MRLIKWGALVLCACEGWVVDPSSGAAPFNTAIDVTTSMARTTTPAPPIPDAPQYLELYALDIWGQALPEATVSVDGQPLVGPIALAPLSGPCVVRLSAPEHEDLVLNVGFDGSAISAADARHGVATSHDERLINGQLKPVYTLYLGLRHKWFSAQGRPARRGNDVELLMDGEQAWGRVRGDLTGATRSVLLSTWWWQSSFELVRSSLTATPAERWPNTILGTLEVLPATKRVLVGQFNGQDGLLSWLTGDAKLRHYAETAGDNFEFMGQANETEGQFHFQAAPFRFGDRVLAAYPDVAGRMLADGPPIASTLPERDVDLTDWPFGTPVELASYHQKFIVVDDAVAFVGGMNLMDTDWDTSEHLVFNPLRMSFDATVQQRVEVQAHLQQPALVPRKDYIVRVAGPSAQDVADVFHERWAGLRQRGVTYAPNTSDFTVKPDLPPQAGGVQAQITATLPGPFFESAIAETWFNAVAQAQDYIYIEDQYFRIPMLVDAIIARMQAVPALKLIVVTMPSIIVDPGCEWTRRTVEQLKAAVGERFTLLQLRSFDSSGVFVDIYLHAKALLVDDTFASIGSANKNDRGMLYEAELNVAVVDHTWVRDARRRMLAAILPPQTAVSDTADGWIGQLKTAAAANDLAHGTWAGSTVGTAPQGFVYSLDMGSSQVCLISAGPEMF